MRPKTTKLHINFINILSILFVVLFSGCIAKTDLINHSTIQNKTKTVKQILSNSDILNTYKAETTECYYWVSIGEEVLINKNLIFKKNK